MKHLIDTVKYAWIDRKLQREVKRRFYTSKAFEKVDRSLLTAYVFKNPYSISKTYLKKRHAKEVHTYGETPLSTYAIMAQEVGLSSEDTYLELGSGRGRGVFFIHHFYGCQAIGIERIPQFVKLSNHLVQKHHLDNISFIRGNMLEASLPKASVVYLYGTCLEDVEIEALLAKLKTLSKDVKIISVSYPLTDYDSEFFCVEKSFSLKFPWGETEGYLNRLQ